jgi:hypothetical protein
MELDAVYERLSSMGINIDAIQRMGLSMEELLDLKARLEELLFYSVEETQH